MKPSDSYWDRIATARLSRRRALTTATGAGLALTSLGLIGCSGGSDAKPQEAASLVSKPVDTSSKAVKGGILTRPQSRDATSFDTEGSLSDLQTAKFVYSRLTKFKAYKYPEAVQGIAEGDAAQSWEVAPDNLTYTYKLRPNMKFDAAAPTNSRNLTSEDVVFSFQRFSAKSAYAGLYNQKLQPNAPWVSVTATDASTVVIKLAYPYAPQDIMAGYYASMPMMPVEADGKFDPKSQARGTAAWRLKEWLPSSRVEFVKNPNWYDAAKVNLDGVTMLVMPEYANQLAQFRTGALVAFGGYPLGSQVKQEDVLQLKKDLPQLVLQAREDFDTSANSIKFSHQPNQPFADVRVRQAVSMLIDRDQYITALYNVDAFEKAGISVSRRWDTILPAGEEWWLDPNGKDFGESAKYLKYNPAEAKKLLQAYGASGPIKAPFLWTNGYSGQEYDREREIVAGMLTANKDFELDIKILDHNSEFRGQVIFSQGRHQGMGFIGGASSDPDVDAWLDRFYRSGSMSLLWHPSDPKMEDFVFKQRQELDPKKRGAILQEIQRYYASQMYNCWPGGASTNFYVNHAFMGNAGLWRVKGAGSEPNETYPYLWIDPTKK